MDEPHEALGVGPSLGGSGPCPTVESGGKVWTIGHPTQRAKSNLEILVAATAIEQLEELKGAIPEKLWEARAAKLEAELDGGGFRTWCPLWSRVNSGSNGTALFLLSLMRDAHPGMKLADARNLIAAEPLRVRAALAVVLPVFFTLLAEAAPVPPGQRAALVATGTSELIAALGPPPADTTP